MSKYKQFEKELSLRKGLIQHTGYQLAETLEEVRYIRIFLTSKKQALVEVFFEEESTKIKESCLNLWSWEDSEGYVAQKDMPFDRHHLYRGLVWRGLLTKEDRPLNQLPNLGSYLTDNERSIFELVALKFIKYVQSNSMRSIFG